MKHEAIIPESQAAAGKIESCRTLSAALWR
jgi:hypothetical protein